MGDDGRSSIEVTHLGGLILAIIGGLFFVIYPFLGEDGLGWYAVSWSSGTASIVGYELPSLAAYLLGIAKGISAFSVLPAIAIVVGLNLFWTGRLQSLTPTRALGVVFLVLLGTGIRIVSPLFCVGTHLQCASNFRNVIDFVEIVSHSHSAHVTGMSLFFVIGVATARRQHRWSLVCLVFLVFNAVSSWYFSDMLVTGILFYLLYVTLLGAIPLLIGFWAAGIPGEDDVDSTGSIDSPESVGH